MADERAMLLKQGREHIDAGGGLTILPSIPGVFDFVVSRETDQDLSVEIGLNTIRTVALSTTKLEPFERTAALLAHLLVPGAESHKEREKIYSAICCSAVRGGFAWPTQRRAYLFPDEAPLRSAMNRTRRLARHRIAAAMMALPYILASPDGLSLPKRREMAELVSGFAMNEDDGNVDPKNVAHRVWAASLPVLHLAISAFMLYFEPRRALMHYMAMNYSVDWSSISELNETELQRLLSSDDSSYTLRERARQADLDFMFLMARDDTVDWLLAGAETFARHIQVAPTLTQAATRLVRFQLQK
jgi:hypothetical protein